MPTRDVVNPVTLPDVSVVLPAEPPAVAPTGTAVHWLSPSVSTPARPAVSAVCLDVDDTLVDYGHAARTGLTEIAGSAEHLADWNALTDAHQHRFLVGEVDFRTALVQRTKEFFARRGEPIDDRVAAEREDRRMACVRSSWRLFDDVLPCLHLLRSAGLMLAAVTNACVAHQRRKLAAVGLLDAFDVLVMAEEVGVPKPDPRIFQVACERLRVPAGQAVHVGDRLDADALGAHGAGLHAVWLDRQAGGCSAAAAVDAGIPAGVHVIGDLWELVDLVGAGGPEALPVHDY